jgi:hypothetical protein
MPINDALCAMMSQVILSLKLHGSKVIAAQPQS